MELTRNEIATLLKKSARQVKKSREIHRKLQVLMRRVDRTLALSTLTRKPPK